MFPNVDVSTRVPLLEALPPVSQGAGAGNDRSTGWMAVADYFNFMAVINGGALGSSATLDAKVEQATDSSGTGAKDVAAITQITTDNQTAVINVNQEDIDIANDFTHIRLTLSVGAAASQTAGALFGSEARYETSANNAANEVV